MKFGYLLWGLLVSTPFAFAGNYYVAPPASGGSDSNPGTLASPFATIQRAANSAVAGDSVMIRAGIYREAVIPANSGTLSAPITYQNYNSEVAVVSGADVIAAGSWSVDAGNVYKAPLSGTFFTSTMNQALQVFVDGEMVTLAKWPNTTTIATAYPTGLSPAVDISHPAKSTITSFISKNYNDTTKFATGVVVDSMLPAKAAGFYDGAEIFFQPNNGAWSWAFSGTVSSVPANGNEITFTSRNNSGQDGSGSLYQIGSRYYLFNKKQFLDSAGEWWHDKTAGLIYLWTPTSVNPSTRLVEMKKRDYAFNLSNRNYITVQGLTLFACTITTDTAAGGDAIGYDAGGTVRYSWRGAGSTASSTGVVLDGLTATYLNHYTDISGHFFMQWGTASGFILSGTGHTIRNSNIQKSAGNGIAMQGANHTAFNNVLNDLCYAATDTAAITTTAAGIVNDVEIAYNTIRRVGRSGITPRSLRNSNVQGGQFKTRIHHNDIAQFGLQDWDVGGIYTATGDGRFARIDHNLISEGIGYTASGIYLDYEKNWVVDHNVVWNVEWGLKFHGSNGNVNNILAYNNTSSVRNTSAVPFGPFAIGNGIGNNNGTVLRNNLLSVYTPPVANGYQAIGSGAGAFSGAEQGNNLAWDGVANSGTDPKFISRATTLGATGVNYMLQTGSAAINAGSVITSYTRDGVTVPAFADSVTASPDAGAYEFGSIPWVAGANLSRCAEPIPSPWPRYFGAPVTVTLRSLTAGATIRYTTDGSIPTATTGNVYTLPFLVNSAVTLRCITTVPGLSDSPVGVHFYDVFNPPALGTPAGFTAMVQANGVLLNWTDNASAETGIQVERRLGTGGTWQLIHTTSAEAINYTDATTSSATEYSYRLRAINGTGSGSYTAELIIISRGIFTQPATLITSQTANSSVTLPIQIRNVSSTAQTFNIPNQTRAYQGSNSSQLGGPPFDSWDDISGTGTPIAQLTPNVGGTIDDVVTSAINIGFAFPFYNNTFSQLKVGSNGFLTFNTSLTSTLVTKAPLPSTSTNHSNLVAFLWDDLYFSHVKSSRAYSRSYDSTGGSNPDTFVIQFSNVVLFSNQLGPTATLQVILKKNGTILCKYLTMQPGNVSYTIGLNNSDGTQGLLVVHNQALLTPNFAVQMSVGIDISNSPSSLVVPAGGIGNFQMTLNSAGLPLGVIATQLNITSNLSRQPTISLPIHLTVLAANPTAPATPSGFGGTGTATSASLAWSDGVGENSYKLERSLDGSSNWTQIAWLGQNTAAMIDADLASAIYHYRLRASNAGGDSAYTSTVSIYVGNSSLQTFRTVHSLAANGSDDLATPANDGVANLLKFAFNMLGTGTGQATTLGTANAAVLGLLGNAGLPLVSMDGTGKLQLTYIRRKAASNSGITYAVSFSPALTNGSWATNNSATEVTTSLDATFERVTVTDSLTIPKRFVRVEITAL